MPRKPKREPMRCDMCGKVPEPGHGLYWVAVCYDDVIQFTKFKDKPLGAPVVVRKPRKGKK